MPEWTAFYWAIGVLLCAQVVLRFFRLVRWLPRPKARIVDVILRGHRPAHRRSVTVEGSELCDVANIRT